jgi:hypothetical protein
MNSNGAIASARTGARVCDPQQLRKSSASIVYAIAAVKVLVAESYRLL